MSNGSGNDGHDDEWDDVAPTATDVEIDAAAEDQPGPGSRTEMGRPVPPQLREDSTGRGSQGSRERSGYRDWKEGTSDSADPDADTAESIATPENRTSGSFPSPDTERGFPARRQEPSGQQAQQRKSGQFPAQDQQRKSGQFPAQDRQRKSGQFPAQDQQRKSGQFPAQDHAQDQQRKSGQFPAQNQQRKSGQFPAQDQRQSGEFPMPNPPAQSPDATSRGFPAVQDATGDLPKPQASPPPTPDEPPSPGKLPAGVSGQFPAFEQSPVEEKKTESTERGMPALNDRIKEKFPLPGSQNEAEDSPTPQPPAESPAEAKKRRLLNAVTAGALGLVIVGLIVYVFILA